MTLFLQIYTIINELQTSFLFKVREFI